MGSHYGRCSTITNAVGLVLYLAGGWRCYQDIADQFGWTSNRELCNSHRSKTAWRHVKALEEAGLPIEWSDDHPRRMRLPSDWVARTPWLRRYIILKEPKGA